MDRPQDIQMLSPVVDRLVTCGGARVSQNIAGYLQYVGVAGVDEESDWIWPTQHFLRHALPAADATDLLRRVVLRDPQYRLYIDLSMCSVIHSVAVSERWQRLEDLLLGQCKQLAPRLCQLLSWLSDVFDCSIREIPSAKVQDTLSSISAPVFRSWDINLWGDARGPADLFPLLMDLYIPLTDQPFHVPYDAPVNHSLLNALIDAATKHGEGLLLSLDDTEDLRLLQRHGLPIRIEPLGNQRVVVYLVGTVELVDGVADRIGEPAEVDAGLSECAKASRVIVAPSNRVQWSIQNCVTTLAPISVDHDASQWPVEFAESLPDWLKLPGSNLISTAAKRRKDSQDADVALEQIARHPLYGFVLQLFLMEALDRELGEETVALALPQNRKLESADDWAATRVLYRAREEAYEGKDAERDGFLVLGAFDEVIAVVAHQVGIEGIATPYRSNVSPLSRAVYLMSTAGIVDGRPHSWRLTITNVILDRLHSGSLMKGVIRGGREIRDRMHDVFSELWKQRTLEIRGEQIRA
jgi:hypothetical protein